MVRLYGQAPYKIVLVHGGPGAIGSLKGFAKELNTRSKFGVVEAFQSKYSIHLLVEELYYQIRENCSHKVTLIGHSWGAWLAALFAEQYPELIEQIVLVGCPPLEDKYVSEISTRRTKNLSEEDQVIFNRLASNQATSEDMAEIPKILEKSDHYCLENKELHSPDENDDKMLNLIWKEAAALRTSGKLLASFQNILCKIILIQGELDPHPARGVTIPLQENNVECEAYLLEKCGHSPFMEKYAKEPFYDILLKVLS